MFFSGASAGNLRKLFKCADLNMRLKEEGRPQNNANADLVHFNKAPQSSEICPLQASSILFSFGVHFSRLLQHQHAS